MFLRLLLASVVRRWPRRARALVAIWAGLALFTALAALGLGVSDAIDREMASFGANLRIEPLAVAVPASLAGEELVRTGPATFAETDLAAIDTIFWRNNVVAVSPRFRTIGRTDGSEATILGLEVESARRVDRHQVVAGSWPGPGECLAGEVLANRLGLETGRSIDVELDGERGRWTISGVLSSGSTEDDAIVASLRDVQRLARAPGRITDAEVTAITTPENELARRHQVDPASLTPKEFERWACTPYPENVARQIQEAIPGSSVRVVRRVAQTHGVVLSRLSGLLEGLGLLGLSTCALAVLGILAPAFLARAPEAALLVALGAHRSFVRALFLVEAALLGLAGGALGALTGSALGAWSSERVFGPPADPPAVLLLLGPLVGAALASIASGLPIRRVLAERPAARLHA